MGDYSLNKAGKYQVFLESYQGTKAKSLEGGAIFYDVSLTRKTPGEAKPKKTVRGRVEFLTGVDQVISNAGGKRHTLFTDAIRGRSMEVTVKFDKAFESIP